MDKLPQVPTRIASNKPENKLVVDMLNKVREHAYQEGYKRGLNESNKHLRYITHRLYSALSRLFDDYNSWTSNYKGAGIDSIRELVSEALAEYDNKIGGKK